MPPLLHEMAILRLKMGSGGALRGLLGASWGDLGGDDGQEARGDQFFEAHLGSFWPRFEKSSWMHFRVLF